MKEKTFEEIKVSNICDEALVNRSTFYAHFEDKYSLLSSLLDNLKQAFIGAVVNVGMYWLYNINKYTKEEVIEYLIKLIPDEGNKK